MRLYIIGPVTGRENDNINEFNVAASKLESRGHEIDIPHLHVFWKDNHETAMLKSIHCMTQWTHCFYDSEKSSGLTFRPVFDGVAMLDGWEDSPGASLEKTVAEACGIPCKPWSEWL